MSEQGSNPWWKEPWPWILISGPAAAVVGCAITIVLAVQNFSDQTFDVGAVKRGLVVDRVDAKAPLAPPADAARPGAKSSSGSQP